MALNTIKKSGIFVVASIDGKSREVDCIAEAKALAIAENTVVVLEFNEVLLKITPDSDVDQVREMYMTTIDPAGEFFI